ncbi:MAG: hypothetical protein ACUBOA_11295 [Candidatus Loosdrechtia sp.]|uniref:hypothetical protein n=1 Tax=Candidatus Loosdrechtia sp. TaxID=3101272 RepID=UPI003A766D69|nr:MAG: hypothetical protein QY305_01770 [Candidatus Jettenia sp. AMX2]
MTRFVVFLIAVYVLYYLIKSNFKSKADKNIRRTYAKKHENSVNPRLKEIAYVFYSAVKDGSTCEVCIALDGKHVLPGHKILPQIKPPHAGCRSTKGCRCTLVYVTRDEEGGREIESFLKKQGGVCDRQTIEREFAR